METQTVNGFKERSLAGLGFVNYQIDTKYGITNTDTGEYTIFDPISKILLTSPDGFERTLCVGWIANMAFFSPPLTMDKESYRNLAYLGCPGFYVTREGHIWTSLKSRWVDESNLKYDGYVKISLFNRKTRRPVYDLLHRVVAKAFIPNPENKLHVNHKDGNK